MIFQSPLIVLEASYLVASVVAAFHSRSLVAYAAAASSHSFLSAAIVLLYGEAKVTLSSIPLASAVLLRAGNSATKSS